MIKNDRQFRITRAELQRIEGALSELEGRDSSGVHPIRRQLELDSVAGVAKELRSSIERYQGLRDGTVLPSPVTDIAALPQALIEHRIAAHLSQKDLAERLGLKEQQIQRYESEDWSTANLGRLVQVAAALGIESDVPVLPANASVSALRRTVERVGIDADLFARRFAPAGESGLAEVIDLTSRLGRVYGWSSGELLSGSVSEPEPLLAAASFKLPKRHNASRTNAYTVYSHYLSLQALAATPNLRPAVVPDDPNVMRELLAEARGATSYERALDVAWSLGVVVLPLADPGAFHAVLWRHAGRNVVVLKQQNRLGSRWLFDLLHELYHASEDPDSQTVAVIELEGDDGEIDDREYAANDFAGAVLLDGRADEMAQEIVKGSRGRVEALTQVVPRVANLNGVDVGDLAHYLAYRLSVDGVNWWGAATNLQVGGDDPWQLTADRFLREVDLRLLNPLDRDLLVQAISERS